METQEVRQLAIPTVKLGKKKILPLQGAGGWKLMRRFRKIFYRLLDGKFLISLIQSLVNLQGVTISNHSCD